MERTGFQYLLLLEQGLRLIIESIKLLRLNDVNVQNLMSVTLTLGQQQSLYNVNL